MNERKRKGQFWCARKKYESTRRVSHVDNNMVCRRKQVGIQLGITSHICWSKENEMKF